MGNRIDQNPSLTSARQKAVREAWTQEREYVAQGKGTRDWTPQQQNDILNGKTPKDEQGRPYEGHHMVSVSNNKEMAGQKENIQFLSRDEHIQGAHQGKTQNKTEGRYDPDSGKTYKFTEKESITPVPKDLTNPVIDQRKAAAKEVGKEPSEKEKAPAKTKEGAAQDSGSFGQSVKNAAQQPAPVRENGAGAFASQVKGSAEPSGGSASRENASRFASSAKSAAENPGNSGSGLSHSAAKGAGQSASKHTGQNR